MTVQYKTIKLSGVDIDLEIVNGQPITAVHVVKTVDFDNGTAPGPSDGDAFRFSGKKYWLGEHSYDRDGDMITCIADVFPLD